MKNLNKSKKIALAILIVLSVISISIIGSAALLLNINYLETGILEEQTEEYRHIANSFTDQISTAENIFSKLSSNSTFLTILKEEHENEEAVLDLYNSIDFSSLLENTIEEFLYEDLTIYTSNVSAVIDEKINFIDPELTTQNWYLRITQSRRAFTLFIMDSDLYALYKLVDEENPDTFIYLGLVKLNLQLLQNVSDKPYKILISNIALDTIAGIAGNKELANDVSEYLGISANLNIDEEMLLVYDIIPGSTITKWSITLVFDRINFQKEFITYALVIFTFFSLITAGFLYRYSFIRRINKSLNSLSTNDIEMIIANNRPNKIDKLIKNMYAKIESLVKINQKLDFQNREKEAQKNEAEIKALLSQINPHYIFNLLNSIHKRALKNNELESARMILLMSKQLRRSLEWKEPFVIIKDEIDNIKSYITLHEYYLGHNLDFVYEIDELLYNYKVPKLIFQTLIENALKYGVSTSTFFIKLLEKDNFIKFTIKNDFEGEPKDIENKIINAINTSDNCDKSEGIGLKNLSKRLRYYYVDNYKVKTSINKNSVTIALFIPKLS